MRMILLAAALLVGAPIASSTVPPVMAQPIIAQTGSGSQETKPGGTSGGHECERQKKEQVTS
jgi:hypothetical protein